MAKSISKHGEKFMIVSVVIPAYNCSNTIIATLDSIYNQSYQNIEVIVIDDGSVDSTYKDILNYKEQHQLQNLSIHHQLNSGVADARNHGIKLCNGEFISFIDSDDCWHPTKLEQQVDILLKNPDVGLCATLYNLNEINPADHIEVSKALFEISFQKQLYRNYFQPSTVVVRKSVIDNLGGFKTGMTHAEEGLFFLKIVKDYKCVLINKCLINYGSGKLGFGESGLSADLWKMEKGELSNYLEIYKLKYISVLQLAILLPFSMAKFLRRYIISKVLS
jgi:glycosyltransferase involved in cell wall biosynthesis